MMETQTDSAAASLLCSSYIPELYQKIYPRKITKQVCKKSDLSTLHNNYFGLNVKIAPPKSVLELQEFKSAELRFGYTSEVQGCIPIKLHSNLFKLFFDVF